MVETVFNSFMICPIWALANHTDGSVPPEIEIKTKPSMMPLCFSHYKDTTVLFSFVWLCLYTCQEGQMIKSSSPLK